jgi:WD40-like Beta Propeller Repeat
VPAIWTLFAVAAVAIFVTYARLPAYDLYHVSRSGLAGGASRVLVDLNWPVALVAIAIVAIVPGRPLLRVAAAVLCAVVVVPGVVSQGDLDAKPINAVPAVGVVLALAASWGRPFRGGPRLRGDVLRIVAAALVVIAAIPWLAADLGTSILGSDELWSPFGSAKLGAKLHPGHHHGIVGALLALCALALSRPLPQVERRALRVATTFYLGLMLAYGLGNELQDFWLEQLVKRDVTSFELPSVLQPAPTIAWGVVLLAGLLFGALFLRSARRPSLDRAPRPVSASFFGGLGAAAALVLIAVLATAVHGGTASAGPRAPAGEVVGTIAFPMAGGSDQDLYRVTSGSGEPRVVLDEEGDDANPAWSREGRIAFQSDRDGGMEVWLARANEAPRRLTDADGESGEPAWSPDATRIAFASTRAGDADLYILRLSDRRLTRLTADPTDEEWPAWSPDGRRIAFERDGDLFLIGAEGGGLRRLTSGSAEDRLPAWSPDGRRIAYASAKDGNEDLYVLDPVGRHKVQRLTRHPAEDTAPAWDPGGGYLVFLSDRDGGDQLYVVGAAGGEVRRLTDEERDKGRPAWR